MGVAWWLRSILSLLVAVGVLAGALPVAFGSGTRGAGVDPVQVFSSGPLVAVQSSGGAQLSAAGMVPGESRAATLRVLNAGSAPASFDLSSHVVDRVGPGGAPLSSALVLRVSSAGANSARLYSGPLGAMPRLRLGSIAAGAQRAYRFTVTLPAAAGNAVAGSASSAAFAWTAG